MALHEFNSFGLLFIKEDGITVNISAVKSTGSPIHRAYGEEFDEPIKLERPIMVSFAAEILPDGKTKTAFHEIGSNEYTPVAETIPQVGKALAKAFDLIRVAANI